jgi:ferredoxin
MLDFNDAAVRAGLGEIGHCGMFLTPEFGHRQRFQMILTDAELSPTDIPVESICVKCADLAEICPLNAIVNNGKTITICGKTMPVADVNDSICKRCKNGATGNNLHPAGKTDRFAALCSRNCLTVLEDAGVLNTKFEHKFRDRKPWGFVEELKKL